MWNYFYEDLLAQNEENKKNGAAGLRITNIDIASDNFVCVTLDNKFWAEGQTMKSYCQTMISGVLFDKRFYFSNPSVIKPYWNNLIFNKDYQNSIKTILDSKDMTDLSKSVKAQGKITVNQLLVYLSNEVQKGNGCKQLDLKTFYILKQHIK